MSDESNNSVLDTLMRQDMSLEPTSDMDLVLGRFLYRELEIFAESDFYFQGEAEINSFLRAALGNKWVIYWQSPLTFSEISTTVRENIHVRGWFLQRFGSVLAQIATPENFAKVLRSLKNRFVVFEVPEGAPTTDLLAVGDVESLQVDAAMVEILKQTNTWAFYFLHMLGVYQYMFGLRQLTRHGAVAQRRQPIVGTDDTQE